tara:strand:+ start:1090 stop:1374 length:285 start_codon:yes stop_codon:yes gene_type:complete
MSPALGELGKVILKAPALVLQKYPSPLAAVNVAVLIEPVCQSTVPVLPKPDCDAPDAKLIVSPDAPSVIVVPDLLMIFESSETLFILSTLILLS